MTGLNSCLAIVGNPVQWALVAAVAILLFAPRLVPIIARIAGRMVGREVQRRYGIRLRTPPTSERAIPSPVEPAQPQIEAEPRPAAGCPSVPQSVPESVVEPIQRREPRRSSAPVWGVTAVVAGAAAVLLWLLLHAR